LLLAYLRGWITVDTQKQGLRSHLRQEVILSALASELDATAIRDQASASAAALPAFKMESEATMNVMKTILEDMERSNRLREYDRIEQANRTGRRAPTIDGLFKLYQALLDAGVIPKIT
jgi:hypothetical protein